MKTQATNIPAMVWF